MEPISRQASLRFGTFNTLLGTNGGFPASFSGFTFTLTPDSGEFLNVSDVFLAGDDPAAAHIFVNGPNCKGACASGFAADPTAASAVPEPARRWVSLRTV
jgi:hypothetical protein